MKWGNGESGTSVDCDGKSGPLQWKRPRKVGGVGLHGVCLQIGDDTAINQGTLPHSHSLRRREQRAKRDGDMTEVFGGSENKSKM